MCSADRGKYQVSDKVNAALYEEVFDGDMDLYGRTGQLVHKAKAEKYAKIISKTIILSGTDSAAFGKNA